MLSDGDSGRVIWLDPEAKYPRCCVQLSFFNRGMLIRLPLPAHETFTWVTHAPNSTGSWTQGYGSPLAEGAGTSDKRIPGESLALSKSHDAYVEVLRPLTSRLYNVRREQLSRRSNREWNRIHYGSPVARTVAPV